MVRVRGRPAPLIGALVWCVAAVVLVAAATGGFARDDIRFFRIGTGSTGGTYYPIGTLIAQIISNPPGGLPCDEGGSCGVPGLLASAEASAGSAANLRNLAAERIEAALSQADLAFMAVAGIGPFAADGPMPDIKAIASLYREVLHIVVRADSGVTEVGELAGRRVVIGAKGSGTAVDARLLLPLLGLEDGTYEAVEVGPNEAADLLLAGEIDAFLMVGGYPINAVVDLAETIDIRLVPVGGVRAEEATQIYPFFTQTVVPPDVYPGVALTPTLSVSALLVVPGDADGDLVYEITRALWHERSRETLDGGHPKGREIRRNTAQAGVAIPLHPGAERYYAEIEAAATD